MSVWYDALDAAMTVVRDTFPRAVSYSPAAGGGPFALTGVFDEAHEAVEMQGEIPVSTVAPMLWLRLADLAAPPTQGDALTLTELGRSFTVSDVQPDGAGGASLRLLET